MKKLLSLILALSLIISVAPMSFADDVAGEPVDKPGMYFNFNAAAYGKETDILEETIEEYDDEKKFTTEAAVTDPWRIDAQRCVKNFILTSSAPDSDKFPNAKQNALYWDVDRNFVRSPNTLYQSALAIVLDLNETGTFTPTITIELGPSSPRRYAVYLYPVSQKLNGWSLNTSKGTLDDNGDVYLTNNEPLSTSKNITSSHYPNIIKLGTSSIIKLGTIDYTPTESIKQEIDFCPVSISKAEKYYLILASCDPRSATQINKLASGTLLPVNLYSFTLTPTPAQYLANAAFTAKEDTSYTEAPANVTVTRLALYGETSATIKTETVDYGESTTVDAVPATVTRDDGTYNFLYWAKGLEEGAGKQILSTSNAAFSYKPREGGNYLIAVYEKEGAASEAFYNNNGQLLTDLKIVDGVLPALPAMAGRGNATAWVQRGTNDEFAAGATAPTSGDMVFMAKYEEVEDNITINGESYSYGDIVSCKDIVDNFDAENFSCWKRKSAGFYEELISVDANYSFAAYTDCTIEAVCNGAVTEADLSRGARKILLSTFSVGENLTAVMAEFIGFDGAKEKGIMFGSKKIAMTTDYAQFTVTNDTADAVTVTGYAIVGDEKYTDGSISVAGVSAE